MATAEVGKAPQLLCRSRFSWTCIWKHIPSHLNTSMTIFHRSPGTLLPGSVAAYEIYWGIYIYILEVKKKFPTVVHKNITFGIIFHKSNHWSCTSHHTDRAKKISRWSKDLGNSCVIIIIKPWSQSTGIYYKNPAFLFNLIHNTFKSLNVISSDFYQSFLRIKNMKHKKQRYYKIWKLTSVDQ